LAPVVVKGNLAANLRFSNQPHKNRRAWLPRLSLNPLSPAHRQNFGAGFATL